MKNGIDIFKKINRNAFNEKLIHRYLFERYYFGSSVQRRKLLPIWLHKYQINLIVPEDSKSGEGYRADLTLYFQGIDEEVPVEVKWTAETLTKKNQVQYLEKHDGFLVVLGDTTETHQLGIDVVQIDQDDFSDWITENISRLSRESLIYQAGSKKHINRNQYWVVFLKGGPDGPAVKNFDRMLAAKKKTPFWAFRQNRRALPYILDIQKGDRVLFVFGSAQGGGMGHSSGSDVKLKFFRFYECEVVEPYYMALDAARGLFFENGSPSAGDRRWPHFIDFNIKRSFEKKPLDFGKQGRFGKVFADSANFGGGTPQPLSREQYESLKDLLNKIAEIRA